MLTRIVWNVLFGVELGVLSAFWFGMGTVHWSHTPIFAEVTQTLSHSYTHMHTNAHRHATGECLKVLHGTQWEGKNQENNQLNIT